MTREEAIEHLKNMKMPHDKFYEETNETNKALIDKGNEALDMGIEALKNQKTGHWIEQGLSPYEGIRRCSKCYETYDIRAKFNYCPNCGAKMVESQESEE